MIRNMKATGIVRRIDDLGCIVIPGEIRRTLRIRESNPLRSMQVSGGIKGGFFQEFLEMANGHIFREIWKMLKG